MMNGKFLIFVVGAIAGGLATYAAKSSKVRSMAMQAAGKGMKMKNEATAYIASLKEKAGHLVEDSHNNQNGRKQA